MKKINIKNIIVGIATLPLILLFVASCIEIKGNDAPASAKVGDNITVTLNATLDTDNNDANWKRLLVGILAPKSWDLAGTGASVSFTSDIPDTGVRPGYGTLTALDPTDVSKGYMKAKDKDNVKTNETYAQHAPTAIGIGSNYGEVEWTFFMSDQVDAGNGVFDAVISINMKVGDGHTAADIGYWVGNVGDGFRLEDPQASQPNATSKWYDHEFKVMTITGTGSDSTDLTGPAPTKTASVSPSEFMFDDIITLQFDAKEGLNGANTALFNANDVHANAKVKLADGTIVAGTAAKMTLTGNNVWSVTMWPPGFFGVADGNIITELHVNFSNPDGSVVVKNPEFGTDIVFVPNCQ